MLRTENPSPALLLEGVPEGIDLQKVHDALRALPGVRAVHDLHIWEITSGQNSMTVHLVADARVTNGDLIQATRQMAESFGIEHVSVQIEAEELSLQERSVHPY